MDDLEVALEAARAAGRIVSEAGMPSGPEFKGRVNPVTEVDRAAERAITAILRARRPDDSILAEESGGARWDRGRVWIVDPLDGTVNFVHGVPQVAVSVALWVDGEPLIGTVLDVWKDEMFAAVRGGGATLGGRPIAVSSTSALSDALVGTGFPYDRQERAEFYAGVLGRVLARARGIRRIGSAALDLCWVAMGRFDAYWEYGLAPWDAAAAILVVTEAGGRHSATDGGPWTLGLSGLVASNGLVHRAMIDAVGDAR